MLKMLNLYLKRPKPTAKHHDYANSPYFRLISSLKHSISLTVRILVIFYIGWIAVENNFDTSSIVLAQENLPLSISYDTENNLIELNATESQDNAQPITIPHLAVRLAQMGQPDLLTQISPQEWLLAASLSIQTGVRLEATNETIATLRLQSNFVQPNQPTPNQSSTHGPSFIKAEYGGHLLIDGIQLSSWDSTINAVDNVIEDGRSYILAYRGGRVDILRSEVSYLGSEAGAKSGLAWRQRIDQNDAETGATGNVEESKIHHNYFGLYTFEAIKMKILDNDVYQNIHYGIDPHDDSQELEIAYNRVYQNGLHGIILSRRCVNNSVHHNEVFDNAGHGIMLDRGTDNNVVESNLVYRNQDGIAIFQSSNNIIRDNTLRDNQRGIRINATVDKDDPFDALANANQLLENRIENSTEFGIYLYARADQNHIQNNHISGSGVSGIYLKSGGNRLEGNTIIDGENGITINGKNDDNIDDNISDEMSNRVTPAIEKSGHNNIILGSIIHDNRNIGIRILGGVGNQIGQTIGINYGSDEVTNSASTHETDDGSSIVNQINNNANDGITIRTSSSGKHATDNRVVGNQISNNGRYGIRIEDATTVRNTISANTLYANQRLDLSIENGAQSDLQPPIITERSASEIISGTAPAGATVEIYSDTNSTDLTPQTDNQSSAIVHNAVVNNASVESAEIPDGWLTMIGTVRANSAGKWSFALPLMQQDEDSVQKNIHVAKLTALAIDDQGNTSAFGNQIIWRPGISYHISPDDNDQPTLYIDGPGESITLADIQTLFVSDHDEYIENMGNKIWQLKINLVIKEDTELNLDVEDELQELQLRSQTTPAGAVTVAENGIDYARFVYLSTDGGTININGIKVYSWDAASQSVDENISNGRSYILARHDAALNFQDADIGYLGFLDGESYGVSWRDVNDETAPDLLRTRVSGKVIDSQFHHNYYGIYTFQASDMHFSGNKFHHNIRYGFDPHDFSHDFLVENNEAYANGSHGFIISRGCNNMLFRGNISYQNSDPGDNLAHGFMLGPGSPNSTIPQSSSYNNRFENNESYENEGYGVRVLASHNNTFSANNFHHNQRGIVLDPDSSGNIVRDNILANNISHGIVIRETASENTLAENTITDNGGHGVNVLSSHNNVEQNQITGNQNTGISVRTVDGFAQITTTNLVSNTINNNSNDGIELKGAIDTIVEGNMIHSNREHGIYLSKGTSQTKITGNIIFSNSGNGIRTNGIETRDNRWSNNQIYANLPDGINNTSDANNGVLAPKIITVEANSVTGSATPGILIDVYSDDGVGGRYYEGSTTTGIDGLFILSIESPWQAPNITAVATDVSGSSSEFAEHGSPASPILYIYVPLVQK